MPVQVEVPGKGLVEFPDGTTPEVMERALAEFRAPSEHPHARVARLLEENLPSVGGAIGGALGAVGGPVVAAGTAALGGAAGRLGQRVVEGIRSVTQPRNLSSLVSGEQAAPPSAAALVTDAAKSGALEGGLQLAGGVAGKGLAAGGRRLYSGLLKAKDATVQSFPTVVQDLIADARPITQGARRKVVEGMRRIGGEKGRVLAAADAEGKTVSRETLRSGLDDILQDVIAKSEQPGADMKSLAKIEREFIPDEPTVSVSRADAIKSSLQNKAQRGYRQQAMGTRVSDTPMRARQAIAAKAQQAVEEAAPVAELNKQYARHKGESIALRDALKREGNNNLIGGAKDLWALAGAGAGYAASGGDTERATQLGLIARLLATPSTGSRAAILADRIGNSQAIQTALRGLLAVSHGDE